GGSPARRPWGRAAWPVRARARTPAPAASASREDGLSQPFPPQPFDPAAHLGRVPRARVAREAFLVLSERVLGIAERHVGLAGALPRRRGQPIVGERVTDHEQWHERAL